MPDYEVLSRRRELDGMLTVDCVEVQVQGADKPMNRLVAEFGDAAAVLLHDPDRDRLLFVKQLRIPVARHGDPFPIEIVAGKVDGGEMPRDAAVREVREEVGHTVDDLRAVAAIQPSPGILSEQIDIFYATYSDGKRIDGGTPDHDEQVEHVELSTADAFRMLEAGTIRDAKTVVALLWLRAMLKGE